MLPGMLKNTELPATLAYIFVGTPLFWSHWKCHSFSSSFFVGCYCSKLYCTFVREVVVSRQSFWSHLVWKVFFGTVSQSIAMWIVTSSLESVFPSLFYYSLLSCLILLDIGLLHSTSCSSKMTHTLVWGIQGLTPWFYMWARKSVDVEQYKLLLSLSLFVSWHFTLSYSAKVQAGKKVMGKNGYFVTNIAIFT